LRNVAWKGNTYDIPNAFFWMSTDEMKTLADEHDNPACYNDAITDYNRHMYHVLKDIKLSPEAKEVLDYAKKLVVDSFKYRELFNESNPKYEINNWDCGYYQLKALWQEYMPNEFAIFKDKVKVLKLKLIPKVYEFGFLK
jgi:hypothetical protein